VTTYDVHLELIGKHVVDFLVVINKLYSLGVTAKALWAKTDKTSSLAIAERPFCRVG